MGELVAFRTARQKAPERTVSEPELSRQESIEQALRKYARLYEKKGELDSLLQAFASVLHTELANYRGKKFKNTHALDSLARALIASMIDGHPSYIAEKLLHAHQILVGSSLLSHFAEPEDDMLIFASESDDGSEDSGSTW